MELISRYFPSLTDNQKELYKALLPLYQHWNSKINLISRNDMQNFYERHVLFSLSIAKLIRFMPDTQVIDIGTGGGFPGIPLAILFPDCFFTMVDSIQKKVNVVQHIITTLHLTNTRVICSRSENLKGSWEFILGRAVTSLPDFVRQTRHLCSDIHRNSLPNGVLYLSGGSITPGPLFTRYGVQPWDISQWLEGQFFETKKILYVSFR